MKKNYIKPIVETIAVDMAIMFNHSEEEQTSNIGANEMNGWDESDHFPNQDTSSNLWDE